MFTCRKDLWLSSLELKTLRLQVDEYQTGTGGHTGLVRVPLDPDRGTEAGTGGRRDNQTDRRLTGSSVSGEFWLIGSHQLINS